MGCKLTDKDLIDDSREHPAKATTKIRRRRFAELMTDEGGFAAMAQQLDRLVPLVTELAMLTRTRAEAAGLIAALAQLTSSTAFMMIGTSEDPGIRHCEEMGGLAAAHFDTIAAIYFAVVEDMKREGQPVDSVSEMRFREAPPNSSVRIQCEKCDHRDQCAASELRKQIVEIARYESKVRKPEPADDIGARAQCSVDELIRAINSNGGEA